MAKASVGEGTYADLVILEFDLTDEEYAVGFRVGSDLNRTGKRNNSTVRRRWNVSIHSRKI
jgi:hypothetical protein